MQNRSTSAWILFQLFVWIPLVGATTGLIWSRFIPSELTNYSGIVLGVICAIAWVVMFVTQKGRFDDLEGRGLKVRVLRSSWGRGIAGGLIGFMFGYTGFAWGYPWLLNKIVGSPSERMVLVTGWTDRGAKVCAHPDVDVHVLPSPDALCVAESAQASIPVGSYLRLVGHVSRLGINVERIYVVSARSYRG